MPPASRRPPSPGRWRAIALSLLVHGLIAAAAVLGWFTWKHEPPETQTLAIEATVIDERALKGIATRPQPAPEPPRPEPVPEPEPTPPEEQGPPAPDPEELKRKEQELAAEQADQEKQRQLEREKEEQQQLEARQQAERLEAEKQAAARAAAEKAAAEKAAADRREAEKKKAEEAAAARKAAEEKARQAAQEELRRSLEAEERANAARSSPEANRWHNSIVAKIERAWNKPASALPGVTCIVLVSQVPGGEVTSVKVNSCSINDAALRESVETAVLRASPLPTPPAGVPFERNLELTFAPSS